MGANQEDKRVKARKEKGRREGVGRLALGGLYSLRYENEVKNEKLQKKRGS